MDVNNLQFCRICISPTVYPNCPQMISIFGEDSLWQKITTLADVKIEKDDTLPQQVCVSCAKNTISACLFKKKCEDADNFFRQQLLIQKIEGKTGAGSTDAFINLSECDEEEAKPLNGHVAHYEQCNTTHKDSDGGGGEHEDQRAEDEDERERNGLHTAEDGEIKSLNGKPPFDFNSIRLMHEYMQQHLNKINGSQGGQSVCSGSEAGADDEETLPLIPEIELITPSEDMVANGMNGEAGGKQTRGYQCPNCFQIFEMKQILKAHMQSVHGTPGPVYECSNCKKTYFYKRFLEKHVRRGRCVKKRRNQTRPMQCSDCHVLFPTGHHLGWHKRTGCPSRAAKMPLQQLFKQNIVQYNNFPKRIGMRKPENAVYLHNRKLIISNKRKGRTRIKLDAKKIALAKQLILREATTTVIANELNISRTFAWRLRKSLVNGVSLHERVIDPNAEEVPESLEGAEDQSGNAVKTEKMGSGDEEGEGVELEEEDDDGDDEAEDNAEMHSLEQVTEEQMFHEIQLQQQQNGRETAKTEDDGAEEEEYEEEEIEDDAEEEYEGHDLGLVKEEQTDEDNPQADAHRLPAQPHLPFLTNMAVRAQLAAGVPPNEIELHKHASSVAMPMLTQFPPAVAAALNQLPVNLSIRPIATMQSNQAPTPTSSRSSKLKKPRKPNVFIDDEKYAMAKMLVAQNSSTMEIARALNVSQMTAWKVRDAIVKGVPLSYRSKKDMRSGSSSSNSNNERKAEETQVMTEQQQFLQLQQQQLQQQKQQQQQALQQQKIQQQQQQQQLQLWQQQQIQQAQQHQQQQEQQQLQLQQQQQLQQKPSTSTTATASRPGAVKMANPRRRLKAYEREIRDKEITREILELIKEDSNIQYWKVSARLAEKGYPISPSSVCQKLKSMGFHRRWKPGDKPPMLDMEQMKATSTAASVANSSSADESYEPQFDMGGAHFLSAFTR